MKGRKINIGFIDKINRYNNGNIGKLKVKMLKYVCKYNILIKNKGELLWHFKHHLQ